MARRHIGSALRAKIAADAHHRCGYCLTPQSFTAMPMHVEHIVPLAAGGDDGEANLWLACPSCNAAKASRTEGVDPVTGISVRLFNPRTQDWQEHFTWVESGLRVAGRTPAGRVTVDALRMNNERVVQARRRWVAAGWHPPED